MITKEVVSTLLCAKSDDMQSVFKTLALAGGFEIEETNYYDVGFDVSKYGGYVIDAIAIPHRLQRNVLDVQLLVVKTNTEVITIGLITRRFIGRGSRRGPSVEIECQLLKSRIEDFNIVLNGIKAT